MTQRSRLLSIAVAIAIPVACAPPPLPIAAKGASTATASARVVSPAVASARPRRAMSTDALWFGDWGCGHYAIESDNPAELFAAYPRQCWLERGCPRGATEHPAPPCPVDVPVVEIRDLVDEPSRFAQRSKVVVRGTLAVGKNGNAGLAREPTCGISALRWVQLEAILDGACYAVLLSQSGLGCPQDASRTCCGDLPMGEEVAFVARYVDNGGEGPFFVELADADLCTLPGEDVRRPTRPRSR